MVTLNQNKVVTLNCNQVVNITEFYTLQGKVDFFKIAFAKAVSVVHEFKPAVLIACLVHLYIGNLFGNAVVGRIECCDELSLSDVLSFVHVDPVNLPGNHKAQSYRLVSFDVTAYRDIGGI